MKITHLPVQIKRRPDTQFLYCSMGPAVWLLSHQPHHQHQSFVIALIRHPRSHHFLFRHRHPSRRRLTSPTLAAAQESSTPAVDHPSQPYSHRLAARRSLPSFQITSIACVVSPHCSPITAVTIRALCTCKLHLLPEIVAKLILSFLLTLCATFGDNAAPSGLGRLLNGLRAFRLRCPACWPFSR